MATLRDYFETESREQLERLEEALARGENADVQQLHRIVRALRGTAQMAREEPTLRAAVAMESATRALTDGRLVLDENILARLRDSAADLKSLSTGGGGDEQVAGLAARWSELGVAPEGAARQAPEANRSQEFLDFAAREVVGIAQELERGVALLLDQPMDRESLKAILRRQRALLGAARLDEIPILAETLRAVEDLIRVIAKLNVAVKNEWLDVFRSAREILKSSVEPLQGGRQPEPSNALSRLRVLREELIDRHGAGEAVSAAHNAGLVQPERVSDAAQPTAPTAPAPPRPTTQAPVAAVEAAPAPAAEPAKPQPPAQTDLVDIRTLLYRGDAAVQRARALRPMLERSLGANAQALDALDEVYTLLDLARE